MTFLFVIVVALALGGVKEPQACRFGRVVMVGAERHTAAGMMFFGTRVMYEDKPVPAALNLRISSSRHFEIFNKKNGVWVRTPLHAMGSVAYDSKECASVKNLSECDHLADVHFEIENAEPGSSVYANNKYKGDTDKNGIFSKKVATICKNDICEFKMIKSGCRTAKEDVQATSNPFSFKYVKIQSCGEGG